MSEDLRHQVPQDLNELERALSALRPTPPKLDRDQLMFAAGLALGQTTRPPILAAGKMEQGTEPVVNFAPALVSWRQGGAGRGWRLVTAAAALLAITFAALYLVERQRPPTVIRQLVTVPPAASPSAASPAVDSFARAEEVETVVEETEATPAEAQGAAALPMADSLAAGFHPLTPFVRREPPADNYLAIRRLVLTRGFDALPHPADRGDPAVSITPQTARELLREFLPEEREERNVLIEAFDSTPVMNFQTGETI
jgi:hypothetical protein